MNIGEIGKSFTEEVRKRMVNPFFGSFILIWSALNWKIIFILLFIDEQYVSTLPNANESGIISYKSKIEYLDSLNLFNYEFGIIYPFIITLLIVMIIYPLSQFLGEYLDLKKKYILDKINGRELLTKKESNIIKKSIISKGDEHSEELEKKDEQIQKLRDERSSIRKDLRIEIETQNKEEIDKLEQELTKRKKSLQEADKLNNENYKINSELKEKVQILEKSIDTVKNENLRLKKEIDNPSVQKNMDYEEFKKSKYYKYFPELVIKIEKEFTNSISSSVLKYFELKGIIGNDGLNPIYLTSKGDEYLSNYYDQEDSEKILSEKEKEVDKEIEETNKKIAERKQDNGEEDISIEDIPF